jgi:type II secretory pathway pseudopilin PulG
MVGSQSGQAQTQLRIDNAQWGVPLATDLTILLRNTGSTGATIESVSVRLNTAGSLQHIDTFTVPVSIDIGKTLIYTFDDDAGTFAWGNSQSYVIRVTSTTGFYYELVATTPSA